MIEGLQKNQVSPVLALDQLAEAVQKTQFVWLSSLEQKDVMLNMTGTGTSLNAIADFYSNLNATGYFKNIDLGQTQESSGNFTFSLKCEFAPPRNPVPKHLKCKQQREATDGARTQKSREAQVVLPGGVVAGVCGALARRRSGTNS